MKWFHEIWLLGLSETHISTIILNKMSCFHSLGVLSHTNRRWGRVSPNSHTLSRQCKQWQDWRVSGSGHSHCEEESRFLLTSLAACGFRGKVQGIMFSHISYANGRIKVGWAGECWAITPGIRRTMVTLRCLASQWHEGPALRSFRSLSQPPGTEPVGRAGLKAGLGLTASTHWGHLSPPGRWATGSVLEGFDS